MKARLGFWHGTDVPNSDITKSARMIPENALCGKLRSNRMTGYGSTDIGIVMTIRTGATAWHATV